MQCVHLLRICNGVASQNGRHGSGRIPAKGTGALFAPEPLTTILSTPLDYIQRTAFRAPATLAFFSHIKRAAELSRVTVKSTKR